ncbi:radical SAM protein [Candidatus Woesearchaeota archaeon]|nr:radical SAM protein [Candidatus Woesearchaeota archaeon]
MKSVQVSKKEELMLKGFNKVPNWLKRVILKPVNKLRISQVKKFKTPKMIMFYVTDNCNLKCRHCFYWKSVDNPNKFMNLEQIEKVAFSLDRLDLLGITGGEPFVRNDIVDIVKVFVENNKTKRVHIASNGFLVDKIENDVKEILKYLEDSRLTIQFSLDGFEELHDQLRGIKGSFRNVCEIINRLNFIQDSRLAVSVATVVMRKNFSQMRDFKNFVNNDLKVNIKFNVLRKIDSVKGVPKEYLADFDIRDEDFEVPMVEQLEELINIIDDGSISSKIEKKKIEYSISILKGRKAVECLAGWRDAVIFPNGDVSICEPILASVNLKTYDFDFEKLWNSEEFEIIKNKFRGKCFCMNSCNLLNAMQYDTNTLANL